MIIEPRIKAFEAMGLGLFVHFGLYSVLGRGEWVKHHERMPDEQYETLTKTFDPAKDWATRLVGTAKRAGCRYITLTARHHDGFSLYDTCGLNDYDAVHTACGRDLIAEFVQSCRAEGILPFFYHTLLDWREKSYRENFPEYLDYLRKSVEILCTRYGKIGGIWFDGKWDKPNEDWQEDALYGMIRKHQPDAIIINNTGLGARGQLGHIELDSVTFERGRPGRINLSDSPKYIASEMCQTMGDTWGYGANDLNYKSPAELIGDLCVCRRCGSNLLLNVGPCGDGTLRPLDSELLGCMGRWIEAYGEAIHTPRPTDIEIEGKPQDFILRDGDDYYLFCYGLGMSGDGNVAVAKEQCNSRFALDASVKRVTWMDNGQSVAFEQADGKVSLRTTLFPYGTNLVVRVAKIET